MTHVVNIEAVKAPRRRGPVLAVALWLVFAFVTWNVVFDREVALAAIAFTREQILLNQAGRPVSSIDEAFRPRLRTAALTASAYAGMVLAIGAAGHAVYQRTFTRRPTP